MSNNKASSNIINSKNGINSNKDNRSSSNSNRNNRKV